MRQRCRFTQKVGYKTESIALHYSELYLRKHHVEQLPYLCKHCGYWHLTTKHGQDIELDAVSKELGFSYNGELLFCNGNVVPIRHLVMLYSHSIKTTEKLKRKEKTQHETINCEIAEYKHYIKNELTKIINSL